MPKRNLRKLFSGAIPFLIFVFLAHPTPAQESDLKKAADLDQKIVDLYQKGQLAEAALLAQDALEIKMKVLGPEHPETAASLHRLAEIQESMGNYAQAAPLYQRVLTILEKTLGPEAPDIAVCLNNLAGVYRAMGAYSQSEPLYQRALMIDEKAYGPEHEEVAVDLDNLGQLFHKMGDYFRAEFMYKRALDIRNKILGQEDPRTAGTLNNLAELYVTMGSYDQAEILHKNALTVYEKTLGPEHPHTAASLNNLAGLYESIGAYDQAEPLYRRALAICEKALGPEHPHTATSLNNLAGLYRHMGSYAKAEPLFRQALAISEKAFGPEHPEVAISLNNLALIYKSLGKYDQAELLHQRALAIREKILGPEHPHTASSLNNLAALFISMGDYDQAEPLLKRALSIDEKVNGPMHEDVATDKNNLAELYRATGNYARAEALNRQALEVWEKLLGSEHPHIATSLNNLATLKAAQGENNHAFSLQKRAQAILAKMIDRVIGFTSEEQQLTFLATNQAAIESFLGLIAWRLPGDLAARQAGLDVWLRRKGILLEAQRRFQEALLASDDPEAIKIFQELARIRTELSQLIFSGPEKERPEAYNQKIVELEEAKKNLEAKLSSRSQAYAQSKKTHRVDTQKVAALLPAQSVLLEFVKIREQNFQAKGAEDMWRPTHYLVFVLPARQADKLNLIDLGPAEVIDRAVTELKKAIEKPEDSTNRQMTPLGQNLYHLVFAKLISALGGARDIFISPDGQLNLIPFEILQGPDGRFLIDDYTFNYLASGRDMLSFGEIKAKTGKPILLGDPDYDTGDTGGLAGETRQAIYKRSRGMRGLSFNRLPGTLIEVIAIQEILGPSNVDIYTGSAANEDKLFQRREPPRLLHLATHGFFLSDEEFSSVMGSQTRDLEVTPDDSGSSRPAGKKKAENPLVRSGLALAGANQSLRSTTLDQSDGLLTAEKVLGLRLRGTDLVTMSACQTGLGEVKTGEGVYGLRRAFLQAGAKSLVMSMWSVPDQETQELMVEFYKNISGGGMNRAQALRQAILKEKQVVQARYGEPSPLFWGAFVFLGEPGL